MSDIHYIKIIASINRNINPVNDDALQKNNTDFPSGTGLSCYLKIETFRALIKHIEKKNSKCKISFVKNFISVQLKHFAHNQRFVTCKPPGYQAMHMNPTTRGKIIFKINPLDRVFPTWVMEGSPPH